MMELTDLPPIETVIIEPDTEYKGCLNNDRDAKDTFIDVTTGMYRYKSTRDYLMSLEPYNQHMYDDLYDEDLVRINAEIRRFICKLDETIDFCGDNPQYCKILTHTKILRLMTLTLSENATDVLDALNEYVPS